MRTAAGPLLLGAAAVLLTLAVFFGGGSGDERLFWIGTGSIAVTLVAAALSLAGRMPAPVPDRAGAAALALLAAFVAWNGVSIWWSVEPDRSWDYLNRGLVYLAICLLGLWLGRLLPRSARVVADGLALLVGAALVWALAGKIVPALFEDGGRIARLRSPVGYWNGLGLLGAVGLPLFLRLGARRPDLGALSAYLATVAILLTYSRGGLVVAVAVVVAWVWIGPGRQGSLRTLTVAVPVALAVSAIGFALPGVARDLQPESVRVRDGAWFGLALLAGAMLTIWLARRDLRAAERRLLAGVAVLLVAGGIGALAAQGGFLEELRSDAAQVTQGSARLGSVGSNNRRTWWEEAWEIFERAPAGGKGAGSFEVARRPLRRSSLVALEPHNVPLQFLAETGLVGFLLLLGAAVAGATAVSRAVRRLEGEERTAAAALAAGLGTYAVHAVADFDWDFVAVSAPFFFVLGVLLGRGGSARRSRRPLLALAAVLVGLGSLYSLTAPWLADRRVEAAYDAIAEGRYAAAVERARDARSFDPLSIEPLHAWALAEAARGNRAEALYRYRLAVELQPENSTTWYALGAYELELGLYRRAYRDLDLAYGLDRYGPAGIPGGLLDQARAKVGGAPPAPR